MLKAFAYRIYPTKPQLKDLEEHLNRTRELYNAALQERRDAYKKAGKTVTAFEQMRSLALIKEGRPEYRRIHAHVLQGVITQLDRAFQGFFRRVKAGEKAGYPRFKSKDRWNSFHFKQVWDNGRDNWFGPRPATAWRARAASACPTSGTCASNGIAPWSDGPRPSPSNAMGSTGTRCTSVRSSPHPYLLREGRWG